MGPCSICSNGGVCEDRVRIGLVLVDFERAFALVLFLDCFGRGRPQLLFCEYLSCCDACGRYRHDQYNQASAVSSSCVVRSSPSAVPRAFSSSFMRDSDSSAPSFKKRGARLVRGINPERGIRSRGETDLPGSKRLCTLCRLPPALAGAPVSSSPGVG